MTNKIIKTIWLALLAAGCSTLSQPPSTRPRTSIVRVRAGAGWGAGFVVAGREGQPIIATAFHVIASGEPPIVEREVSTDESHAYVEAFPATALAAVDEEADLALLEVQNLPKNRLTTLELSSTLARDAEVTSWGFPESSVVEDLGLTSKHGRASNFVNLPVVDRLYERTIKEDAVPAVIVSTDLEPGFSGGPTIDQSGKVVAINTLKDTMHRGQNAAVRASALQALMKRASETRLGTPAADDVRKMLADIETNYLRLAVEQRAEVPPTDIIALSDLPNVSRLTKSLRTYLWSRGTGAQIGLALARMPGETLPTYLAGSTRNRVGECEKAQGAGLDGLAGSMTHRDCRDFEVRPLAWDLVSATLQWQGEPRSYTVGKIEEVNGQRRIYRAQIGVSNRPSTFPVYVSTEAGRLRLRITDSAEKLYALTAFQTASAQDFEGRWKVNEERTGEPTQIVTSRSETLQISTDPAGKVVAQHTFQNTALAPNGRAFACNSKSQVLDVISQTFEGKLETGVVTAAASRRMTHDAPDCPTRCRELCAKYSEDKSVIFKRLGETLLMYRTSGDWFPEAQRFVHDK